MTEDTIDGLEPAFDHDHYALVYESRAEQFDSAAPFVAEGLEAGDRVIYVHHDTDAVLDALAERGVPATAAAERGQLELLDASDPYLTNGEFDPDATIDAFQHTLARTTDAGYGRLRMLAEMGWLLDHDVDLDRVCEYERAIDVLFPSRALVGLCQYDRTRFPSHVLEDVLDAHPHVLLEGERHPNCYYDAPEGVVDGGSTAVDRRLETIAARQTVADELSERERYRSLLRRATDRLRSADPEAIGQITCDLCTEVIDDGVVAFARYDETAGSLEPTAVRDARRESVDVEADRSSTPPPGDRTSAVAAFEHARPVAWEAFLDDAPREFSVDVGAGLTGSVVPVGKHGVVAAATAQSATITDVQLAVIEYVCGYAEAVMDRIECERAAERTDERLAETARRLDRADRVNAVRREVTRSVVAATSREDVRRAVCDVVVSEDLAAFACFGTRDPADDSVECVQCVGDERGYLDALGLHDDWAANEPSGQAARRQSIQVVGDVNDGPDLEHWERQALKRGFLSVVSVPVSYDGSAYGVLSLYGDEPGQFDGEIVDVLADVADSAAHALHSIERKHALVSESVTELEIRVSDADVPLVEFVDETDCGVAIDGVVSTTADCFRMYATVADATPDQIRTFATVAPSIEDVEFLTETERGHACECLVNDRCFVADLVRHNAVPQSVHVGDGDARLVVHVPRETPVREFVDTFSAKYSEAELVARRDRERSLRSVSELRARLQSELSERQLEVLELAYHSGYFERPRERTAEEIAASLDVSHPTVSRHLREAERRVFSMLFDAP